MFFSDIWPIEILANLWASVVNTQNRQLAVMVCMQVVLIIMATIPYGLYHFYSFATRNTIKGPSRLTTELILSTISLWIRTSIPEWVVNRCDERVIRGSFQGSFYVFLASSSRFRQWRSVGSFAGENEVRKYPNNTLSLVWFLIVWKWWNKISHVLHDGSKEFSSDALFCSSKFRCLPFTGETCLETEILMSITFETV